jgi:hypothetical protein
MGKPKPPAQTPMALLLAGSDGMFSKECLKALMKCGFPPIAFGSYSDVKKAQQACRHALGESSTAPSAALAAQVAQLPKETQQFMADGVSGHMAQDALFRDGMREDPCANHPGCAGYDSTTAPCTVNQGGQQRGTPNAEITQTEKQTAAQNAGAFGAPDGELNNRGVGSGVNTTVTTAIKGVDPEGDDKDFDKNAQTMRDKQQASADALQGKQGGGATTTGSKSSDKTGAKGSSASPNKPKGGGVGTAANAKKAIKCAEEFYKKARDKARKDFCDQHRTTEKGDAALGPKEKPTPMPDQASKAKENEALSGDPPRDLKGKKVDPDDAKDRIAANQKKCEQQQADYLAQYYDSGKNPPPYSGMAPGGTSPGAQGGADEDGD